MNLFALPGLATPRRSPVICGPYGALACRFCVAHLDVERANDGEHVTLTRSFRGRALARARNDGVRTRVVNRLQPICNRFGRTGQTWNSPGHDDDEMRGNDQMKSFVVGRVGELAEGERRVISCGGTEIGDISVDGERVG